MDDDATPPVSSSWRRIDAWLAAHARPSFATLNPPVAEEALESAQRVLGVRFPAELAESLRCHDGLSGWARVLPEQSPLPAARIAEHWQMCMDEADGDGLVPRPWDDEPWWHPLWIPWAEDAGGNAHVIDLRPGRECGRLGWAVHDGCGDFSDAWPGLAAGLHEVSQALYLGGGVRGMHPYLTVGGELWWERGEDRRSLNGDPLVPAPVGLS